MAATALTTEEIAFLQEITDIAESAASHLPANLTPSSPPPPGAGTCPNTAAIAYIITQQIMLRKLCASIAVDVRAIREKVGA